MWLRPIAGKSAPMAKDQAWRKGEKFTNKEGGQVLGNIELHPGQVGPETNRPAKGKTKEEQPFEVGIEQRLITPGSLMLNANQRLEQVPRKSYKIVKILGDLDRGGKMCQVGKQ